MEGSRGGGGGLEAGATVALVGFSGGIEDFGRERVDAPSLACGAGGEPPVEILGDT